MRGALTVDEPQGQRWDLALDILSNGPDLVSLGPGLLLNRDTAGPASDGHIHIAVLADSENRPSKDAAQTQVNICRDLIEQIAESDDRFASLLSRLGVVWEYAGDDGSATFRLAGIDTNGVLVWPEH